MRSAITIQPLRNGDEVAAFNLLRSTVRSVNRRDYNNGQIEAWAPAEISEAELELNLQRIRTNKPFVAILDNTVVGFADIQADGYIDQFFCSMNHQGQGIGKALMKTLLEKARAEKIPTIYSDVSITAKPFFLRFGFTVKKRQEVCVRSQILVNFRMVMNIGSKG